MGVWGVGVFDDDNAEEWVDQILESDDVPGMFESIFVYALDTNYVEHEDSCGVTVGCAVIDMIVNGTVYPLEDQTIVEWVEDNKDLDVAHLGKLGAQALEIITSKKSELNEIWEDNADYSVWKLKIEKLAKRIKSAKRKK